nr:hypothetical protein [uncultured Desulfobacter sp.]
MIKKTFYQWLLKKINENTVSFLTVNNLLLVFFFLVCGIVLICFSFVVFGWSEESRNFLTGFITIFSILIATTTAMITFITKSNSEDVYKLHGNFSILKWVINMLELNKNIIENYNHLIKLGIPKGSKIFFDELSTSLKKIQKILEDDKFIKAINVNKYKTIVTVHQLAFELIVETEYYLLLQKDSNNKVPFSGEHLQRTQKALELMFENLNTLKQDIREESGKIKEAIIEITKTNMFFKSAL